MAFDRGEFLSQIKWGGRGGEGEGENQTLCVASGLVVKKSNFISIILLTQRLLVRKFR